MYYLDYPKHRQVENRLSLSTKARITATRKRILKSAVTVGWSAKFGELEALAEDQGGGESSDRIVFRIDRELRNVSGAILNGDLTLYGV